MSNPEPETGRKLKAALPRDILAMIKTVTGVSEDELLDAALDPEKQPALLRKISENAKPQDIFKDAVTEMLNSDRGGTHD